MVNKLVSCVVLSCSFAVMPMTNNDSGSLLFYFISGNKFVSILRLSLALLIFVASFKTLSGLADRYQNLRRGLLIGGLSLIGLGLFSSLASSLGTVLYDYLKPMDLMIILEAGIVFTSTALTLKAPAVAQKTVSVKAKKTTKSAPKLQQRHA